jgi:hypothetical protein
MLNNNKISGIYILTVIRNPASKSLHSTEISLYLAFTNELNAVQNEKNIDTIVKLQYNAQ